jgi:RNA polymerase sigma-70 factor, ECF subfamily
LERLQKTRHSLLLRLSNAQDREAWNDFLEVYESAIFRFACSRGLQSSDAQDVTQKVLAAVLEKSRTWEPSSARGSFGAWLFRVTRNLAAKTWNEQVRNVVGTGDSIDHSPLQQVPEITEQEKTVFQTEYRRALFRWAAERVRNKFEASTWEAFWLNAVDGRSVAEVAIQLGISNATVHVAKCRVMARIRKEIESFEVEFSNEADGETP